MRGDRDTSKTLHMHECPQLAESGSQNLEFPAFLTSALPPEAVIRMVES
jgi:hypothetical protein